MSRIRDPVVRNRGSDFVSKRHGSGTLLSAFADGLSNYFLIIVGSVRKSLGLELVFDNESFGRHI
jgi:hypothetical protein